MVQIGVDTGCVHTNLNSHRFHSHKGGPPGQHHRPNILSAICRSTKHRKEIGISYQQYADDITLVVQASSVEDLVSRTRAAYEKVTGFLKSLGISINGGKSKWMLVGR